MTVAVEVDVKLLGDQPRLKAKLDGELVYVMSIRTTDNGVLWLSSVVGNDEIPQGASTILALCNEPDITTQSYNPVTLKTNIRSCTGHITDVKGTFVEWAQLRYLNSIGVRKAIVQTYTVPRGIPAEDKYLTGTFEWYDNDYFYGKTKLELKDITRTAKEYVFEAGDCRQYASYLTTDVTLNLTDLDKTVDLNDKFPLFAHATHYKYNPYHGTEGASTLDDGITPAVLVDNTERFGYLVNDTTGQIICHKGFSGIYQDASAGIFDRFTVNIVEHGALGTDAVDSIVDLETTIENRQKWKELIYAEESDAELTCMILTSYSISGKRYFPWGLGYHRSLVDLVALATWHNENPSIRVLQLDKKEKGKEFIEKEILPLSGYIMFPLDNGKISFKKIHYPTENSPTIATLTHSNSEVSGPLKELRTDIYNPVSVKWGYSYQHKVFLFENSVFYQESYDLYQRTTSKTIELRLLQPGVHTAADVASIAERAGLQYAFEKVVLQVKAMPEFHYLQLGDPVLADYEHVQVSSSTRPNDTRVKRAMVITSKGINKSTDQVVLTLEGYTQKPDSLKPTDVIPEVPVDILQEGRTDLSTVCTIDANGLVTGSGAIAPVPYYYIGDTLEFDATCDYTLSANAGKFSLWTNAAVTGVADWIDLTGKGLHAGGMGATSTSPAQGGETGFFGGGHGGGGMTVYIYRDGGDVAEPCDETHRRVVSNSDGGITEPRNISLGALELQRRNDALIGLPADLSGSGGAGGGLVEVRNSKRADCPNAEYKVIGAQGGRGGCGYELLCKSYFPTVGTKTKLNGGDATTPVLQNNTYAAHGSGGFPGAMLLILPNGETPINLHEFVEAKPGSGNLSGDKLSKSNQVTSATAPDYRSYYDPSEPIDQAVSASNLIYLPPNSTPQEYKGATEGEPWRADIDSLKSDLEALAEASPDKHVNVFFQDTIPTSPLELDYWGDTTKIDSKGKPEGRQYINSTWSLVPPTDAIYNLFAENYANASESERQAGLIDKKAELFFSDSSNPADWPDPNGLGDMLKVLPLSKMFKAKADGTWDQDNALVDELLMPTSSNMLQDPGFYYASEESRSTYEPFLSSQVNNNGGSYSFGAFGEGGAPGVKIMVDGGGSGPDPKMMFLVNKEYHQAKKGDIFVYGLKAKELDLGGGSIAGGTMGVALYDKDKVLISSAFGTTNFSSTEPTTGNQLTLTEFRIYSGDEECIASFDIDRVQFVRYFFGITNVSATPAQLNVDFCFMQRSETFYRRAVRSSAATLQTTQGNTQLQQTVEVLDVRDEVEVNFEGSFSGDGSGDSISYEISIGESGQPNYDSRLVLSGFVVNTDTISQQQRFIFTGMPTGITYTARVQAWGSAGTKMETGLLGMTVRRA